MIRSLDTVHKLILSTLIILASLSSRAIYADDLSQNAKCSYNHHDSSYGGIDTGPFLETFYFPATTLKISPSFQPSDTTPFATIETPPTPRRLNVTCVINKNDPNLPQDQQIYPELPETVTIMINVLGLQQSDNKFLLTNIPGIEIKIRRANNHNYLPNNLPQLITPDTDKKLGFTSGTKFIIEFYKRSSIHLKHDADNIVLNPQPLVNIQIDHYSLSPADQIMYHSSTQTVTIQSTPECTQSGSITLPYGIINADMLDNSVTKKIDFSIICKTDYDTYIPHAYIRTDDPTESDYIRVTDANSAQDTMGIRISTNDGKPIQINDQNNPIALAPTENDTTGQFSWRATLFRIGTGKPAVGKFSAKAEIVINID